MRKRFSLFYTVLLLSAVYGCRDNSEPVTYTEPVPQKMMRMVPEHDHVVKDDQPEQDRELIWSLPEGWTETRTSGMTISRITPSGDSGVAVTLTRLGGTGGSLTANISRWGSQLGIPQMSDDDLGAVQKEFSHSESDVVLVDFNVLPSTGESSMKVYIFRYPDFSLFLKAMGPKDALAALSDNIEKFAQSISYK